MNKEEILKKVLKDQPKGFRKKFLENPKKTLEELIGSKLGDWKVEIIKIPKKTIVFELPEEIPSSTNVNDEILKEIAAGGSGLGGCFPLSCHKGKHTCH
jgi:hypothetical protein